MVVSQKQIAEKLDVSITTVSRCLHGHPDIHPKTRKRVVELASKMGYHPGNLRRNKDLGQKKLVTLGVLVRWSEDARQDASVAAYHMLGGISAAAAKENVVLATHFMPMESYQQISDLQSQFPALQAGILSGLILIYDWPHEIVRDLANVQPCVTLVNSHLDIGVDCIGNDHSEGVGMIVKHLHSLGHRQFGFLSTARGESWLFPRFAGYMRALKRFGIPRNPSAELNILEPYLDKNGLADAVMEHLRQGVTAWVCADDGLAYDLYSRLTARGLRVPEDISISGFSGLTPPREGCPRVTSAHPPFEQIGAAGVRQLLNRIKHPDEPTSHVQYACEFIEGETTGPAARQDKVCLTAKTLN
ncbi:MAG: LacI family transcriptional regulator [Phycisphaerae bacterium]|nr:LacI family transcriptional regulator [Phycisphaerae bacterium]